MHAEERENLMAKPIIKNVLKQIILRKRQYVFIMVFASIHLTALAQYESFEGPELNTPRNSDDWNKTLGGDENYFFMLRNKGRGDAYYIEKYSTVSLKPEFSILLNNVNKNNFYHICYANNKIWLFTIGNYKSPGAPGLKLYLQIYSDSGKSITSKEEISETIGGTYFGKPLEFHNFFEIKTSPDKKYLFIQTLTKPDQFEITLYNTTDSNPLWKNNFKGNREYEVAIDNKGTIYSIGCENDIWTVNYIKDGNLHSLIINNWKPSKNQIYNIAIPDIEFYPKNNFYNLQYNLDNDTLLVTGFFQFDSAGVFTITAFLKSNETRVNYQCFDRPIQNYINRLDRYYILWANQCIKEDDGYYLVGEAAKIERKSFQGVTMDAKSGMLVDGSMTLTNREYGNTFICKLTNEGHLKWSKMVPKSTRVLTPLLTRFANSEGSFYCTSYNHALYVFQYSHVNDVIDLKNLEYTEIHRVEKAEMASVSVFKISKDGEINLNTLPLKFNLQPDLYKSRNFQNRVFYSSNNKVILYLNEKRNEHFGAIILK
ncbi:MAG: hypothetical protein K0Q95_975 [Bacteroidota bacterium]|jgi:hypothetical protein|nr:hypothetical protein [Bacteroidota bacterium]